MNPSYLCDTNILAELIRQRPNPGVVAWSTGESNSAVAVSVLSIEESLYGLTAKPDSRIESWFHSFLASRCQVLPVTIEIAQLAGRLRGELRKRGKPRTQADMFIAATAQVHGLTLVTRNTRDFEGCNIPLLDPFH